jgi:hypothetical protein
MLRVLDQLFSADSRCAMFHDRPDGLVWVCVRLEEPQRRYFLYDCGDPESSCGAQFDEFDRFEKMIFAWLATDE